MWALGIRVWIVKRFYRGCTAQELRLGFRDKGLGIRGKLGLGIRFEDIGN